MNKDVIYIEPEDDITDIITKIENSKEKIVALVPPKKTGVLRSIVNIKLIAKSAVSAGKTVVLVTTDPSVIKFAAAAQLPVTKNLQSAPVVPTLTEVESAEAAAETEEVVETADKDGEQNAVFKEATEETVEVTEGVTDEDKSDKKKHKKDKKQKKAEDDDAPGNPFVKWVKKHVKLVVGLSIGLVLLIIVGVWAFAIAPAVTVTVGIRTTGSNFSENVTFTEKLTDENAAEGKFYLRTEKIEEKSEVTFEATGKKNVGEKAKGEVIAYAYFPI